MVQYGNQRYYENDYFMSDIPAGPSRWHRLRSFAAGISDHFGKSVSLCLFGRASPGRGAAAVATHAGLSKATASSRPEGIKLQMQEIQVLRWATTSNIACSCYLQGNRFGYFWARRCLAWVYRHILPSSVCRSRAAFGTCGVAARGSASSEAHGLAQLPRQHVWSYRLLVAGSSQSAGLCTGVSQWDRCMDCLVSGGAHRRGPGGLRVLAPHVV